MMCQSKAEGGKRCRPVMNRQAAADAARALAGPVDGEPSWSPPPVDRAADDWSTRPGTGLAAEWAADRPGTLTLTDASGVPVGWDAAGWSQLAADSGTVYVTVSERWRQEGSGVLRHWDGRYLAYAVVERAGKAGTPAYRVTGVVSDDVDHAAAHLTQRDRARLGLCVPTPGQGSTPVDPSAFRQQLAGHRAQLVGDGPETVDLVKRFAAQTARAGTIEAAHGGMPRSPLRTQFDLMRQSAARGEKVTGFAGVAGEWARLEREPIPGAIAYDVVVPAVTAAGPVTYRTRLMYDFSQTRRVDGKPDAPMRFTGYLGTSTAAGTGTSSPGLSRLTGTPDSGTLTDWRDAAGTPVTGHRARWRLLGQRLTTWLGGET